MNRRIGPQSQQSATKMSTCQHVTLIEVKQERFVRIEYKNRLNRPKISETPISRPKVRIVIYGQICMGQGGKIGYSIGLVLISSAQSIFIPQGGFR